MEVEIVIYMTLGMLLINTDLDVLDGFRWRNTLCKKMDIAM
jgi:hypothetical protein